MKKTVAIIVASVAMLGSVSTAFAAGASAAAPGKNKEALILFYQFGEPTGSPATGGVIKNLGGAISGGFYGNTSNSGSDIDAPDSGHGVTPSISPGPQVNGGGGPGTGTSVGDLIQAAH
jgi:hypothetical protein